MVGRLSVLALGALLAACSIRTDGLASGNGPDGGRDAARRDGDVDTVDGGFDGGWDACAGCECTSDMDCSPPTVGPWSDCRPLTGDVCETSGSQTRTESEWRCVSNHCTEFPEMVRQPCTIPTDGVSCGSSMAGGWGDCAGSGCSTTGTHARTVTDLICMGGACASVPRTETEGCTRDPSGTPCEVPFSFECRGRCDSSGNCARASCDRDSDCDALCSGGARCDDNGMAPNCCRCWF